MSDLAGRAVGDEPAVLQEDRPLDDVGELTHLVQNRHQGQPLRAQPLKDLGQGLAAGAVDAGQRLIEDEQLGGADQGPGDEDPLGLPAGEDLDVVRGPVGQPDGVQGGHGLAFGGPAPVGPGAARPQEPGAHHLQGGGRDAGAGTDPLRDVADPLPGDPVAARGGGAQELDAAAGQGHQPQNGLDEGGLARAVGAQDRHGLAAAHGQAHVVQDEGGAQDDAELTDLDGERGRRRPGGTGRRRHRRW